MKMIVFSTNLNVPLMVMARNFFSSSQAITGSYSNFFHIYDLQRENDTLLQADKNAFKAKRAGSTKNKLGPGGRKLTRREEYLNVDTLEYNKKIIHASWHPRENTIALAATNNLFLFQG